VISARPYSTISEYACRDYDAETEHEVGPFYRNQIAADRARIAEMNALEDGTLGRHSIQYGADLDMSQFAAPRGWNAPLI
jgi:hypothetical protein